MHKIIIETVYIHKNIDFYKTEKYFLQYKCKHEI